VAARLQVCRHYCTGARAVWRENNCPVGNTQSATPRTCLVADTRSHVDHAESIGGILLRMRSSADSSLPVQVIASSVSGRSFVLKPLSLWAWPLRSSAIPATPSPDIDRNRANFPLVWRLARNRWNWRCKTGLSSECVDLISDSPAEARKNSRVLQTRLGGKGSPPLLAARSDHRQEAFVHIHDIVPPWPCRPRAPSGPQATILPLPDHGA
jgi:hypothetical protein